MADLEILSKKSIPEIYETLISNHIYWDLYAVFSMYIIFYEEYKTKLPKENRNIVEEIIAFVKTQVYCVPSKRFTVEDILSKFQ
jgi:hypothetical protein